MYRGSRKHILDWTSHPDFLRQFENLIGLPECSIAHSSAWQPRGFKEPDEACIEDCGDRFIPGVDCWNDLSSWWLCHRRGANKPNWDLIVAGKLWGQPGLVLVEAKAHENELDWGSKRSPRKTSENSLENHEHIGHAIAEASSSLDKIVQGVQLSRDSHYQLANRVAYSWKIASMGVPVLLVYLGFTGDAGIANVGVPFKDNEHWQSVMRAYTDGVLPEGFTERRIPCGKADMYMIIRSMEALEQSPSPEIQKAKPSRTG